MIQIFQNSVVLVDWPGGVGSLGGRKSAALPPCSMAEEDSAGRLASSFLVGGVGLFSQARVQVNNPAMRATIGAPKFVVAGSGLSWKSPPLTREPLRGSHARWDISPLVFRCDAVFFTLHKSKTEIAPPRER